jgi:hypothetical protein
MLQRGKKSLITYSLRIVIMPKPQDIFARAPCCHFTCYTGCVITVYNLLLRVPTGLGWGWRDRMYKLPGHGSLEGGWGPGYVACVVIFIQPALAGGPENKFFTKAYPLSMFRVTYGRILSTCTYRYKRMASHRPHIYSC